jgi:hypothetical protein
MKQYKYTTTGIYMESYKIKEKFTDQLETKFVFDKNSCDCYDVEQCQTTIINGKKEEKCNKYQICNTKCKK